jgi:hypothetical protein
MTQETLFDWAENRPTAKILDALPRLLARIRIEDAYKIPRPRREATVIQTEFRRERDVA